MSQPTSPHSRIILGDSLKVLATLEAESIDAVVCDPPYGIEFMGKDWDTFIPHDEVEMHPRWADAKRSDPTTANWGDGTSERYGKLPSYGGTRNSFQCQTCGKRDAFRNPHKCGDDADWRKVPSYAGASPDVLAFEQFSKAWGVAAYRVLKPGGHLLAFGGSRMYHRLACGIEDAGFEIRDCLMWIYGCLTPDVEVLTAAGWRLGIDVSEGDEIAQWDPATEEITLAPVQQTFRAPYTGPMRVLRNADTDQVVTPNHRVFHKTRQRKMEAGHRRSWWPDGWDVSEASEVTRHQPTKLPVAGFADGPGIGGVRYAELLAFVWTEGGFDGKGTGVRIYQSVSAKVDTHKRIGRLVDRLVPYAKKYDRERVYESRVRGAVLSAETCWFFTGEMAARVRRDLPGKQPTYDLLWRMTLAEKVAFLDAAMAGDGSGSSFEQKGRDPLEWFQTLTHLIGWSARVRMRSERATGACSLRRSRTTEMQARHFKAAYDAHYDGDVWCVSVPTGAFIARRNGLVFVTGNSGFPKSLDVSKAIDGKLGAVREDRVVSGPANNQVFSPSQTVENPGEPVTAAAAAAAWEGWGTALKPAHEPIVVARKPLSGTVAETVLAHGTGALNIGGCRVGDVGGAQAVPGTRGKPQGSTDFPGRAEMVALDAGRWPANVMLAHLPECDGSGPDNTDVLCAPGCPVAELNEASGSSRSPEVSRPRSCWLRRIAVGDQPPASGDNRRTQLAYGYGDEGGAARFFYIAKPRRKEKVGGVVRNLHPTVKPVDLMRWLVRLVTPPGGVILDPFLGSGSTGCAAMAEGFRFIGVEREEPSFDTALARVSDWAFAHGQPAPEAERPEFPPAAASTD